MIPSIVHTFSEHSLNIYKVSGTGLTLGSGDPVENEMTQVPDVVKLTFPWDVTQQTQMNEQ